MPRQNVHPDTLAKRVVGGHLLYSHAVSIEGKRLVFISGQVSRDREGNVVGKGDMEAQIRQVGENIKAALEAAGATWDDVVKTTTYVTDIDEFFRHMDARMTYFSGLPASTTIGISRLSHPDFMVEIEAIAMLE